jgi:diaminohydroxyphosphoribosylaminopyrimidine deaminase/5-amino-6-(5-phosphoribosylamino)uracil reductase
MTDKEFMARALRCAAEGLYSTDPNPRVGAVIVRSGQCIAEGRHWRAGEAHAEIEALRRSGDRARGATVYVTLEPCAHHGRTPPCVDALIAAGVARVVVGMQDPNPLVSGRGLERLRAAGIAVTTGVLEAECRALNPGFVSRMERGRPFVRAKVAVSLDGRTAMASGESQWITGPAARADGQQWRARAGAILTGSGTLLADNPRLTVRRSVGELLRERGVEQGRIPADIRDWTRQPLRVVVDSQLVTPANAELFQAPGPIWICTREDASAAALARGDALLRSGVEVRAMSSTAAGKLNLEVLLRELAVVGVNEVHVEAGPGLVGALAQTGLIDEWLVYMAPVLLGSGGRPMLEWSIGQLANRVRLDFESVTPVGQDLRIIARPAG